VPGYWSTTPNTFLLAAKSKAIASVTTTSTACATARVRMTSIVCGWHWSDTSRARRSSEALNDSIMCIASAAAVASSSNDAFATSSAVRSLTTVWKLRSASRRPCETSAWYGVYCVYQAGFSSTLRRMTGGVTQSWYPMPRKVRHTSFFCAMSCASSSSSCSLRAGGRFSGRRSRMLPGMVCSMRSSSDFAPTTRSIAVVSASSGPM
jgi:hypothetical protein